MTDTYTEHSTEALTPRQVAKRVRELTEELMEKLGELHPDNVEALFASTKQAGKAIESVLRPESNYAAFVGQVERDMIYLTIASLREVTGGDPAHDETLRITLARAEQDYVPPTPPLFARSKSESDAAEVAKVDAKARKAGPK